jgi:hypothetical protein
LIAEFTGTIVDFFIADFNLWRPIMNPILFLEQYLFVGAGFNTSEVANEAVPNPACSENLNLAFGPGQRASSLDIL